MKRILQAMALAILPMLLFTFSLQAQTYAINWFTVDGGGGTSTGGVYTVSGTIGQPDAGTMSGGNYSLQGGFWGPSVPLQTPGAPHLWVTPTSTNTVLVWWAVSDISWQLEATSNLDVAPSAWTTYTYNTNGANCLYIESTPIGNKFYRLKKP